MRLGPYEVVRELSRGGSGVVLLARAADGREVAIKLLRSPGAGAAVARFERERRLLATLGAEEGFVPLLETGDSPNGPWLAMEFMPGGTLRDRFKGPLPLDEAIALGRALARAIGVAHARGIIHRDLKPDNVLYDARGRPLIADLGLAKHFRHDLPGASQSVALSVHGEMAGTPGYMPIEQMRDAAGAGPRSDVFSLGAILYECLAGQPAFIAPSIYELTDRVARGEYVPLVNLRPDVPPWLDAVVTRAIALDAAARFADGGELARALGEEVAPARRGRGPIIAAAAIIIIIAVAAVIAFGRSTPSDEKRPIAPPGELPRVAPDKPPEPPRPRHDPTIGFATTRAFRLERVLGSYDGKLGSEVQSIAVARDGARILTAERAGAVRLWDGESGAELASFALGKEPAGAVAFVDDARAVATSIDGGIAFIDLARGEVARIAGHEGPALAVAARANLVATGGQDGTVRLWDPARRGSVRSFLHGSPTGALAFFPDGTRVVSGGGDGSVKVWDVASGTERALAGEIDQITSIVVLPDGRRIVAADATGRLLIFDPATGARRQLAKLDAAATAIVALGEGKRIAAARVDGSVSIVDGATGDELRRLDVSRPDALLALDASADGKRLVTGGTTMALAWLDATAGTVVAPARAGHARAVRSVAVSADGTRVISGAHDSTARIWDAATGKELSVLAAHPGTVYAVAFSPDGRRALTAGGDGTVGVWDVASGRESARLHGHLGWVLGVAFTPDGKHAVSAGRDHTVRVWNIEADRFASLILHEGPVHAVALTPDGAKIVSASSDKSLYVWDAVLLGPISHLTGAGGELYSVAISPDGTRALSSGNDAARLWDLVEGRPLSAFLGHQKTVTSLAFLSASEALVASADGSIRRHELPRGDVTDRIDLATSGDYPRSISTSADGSLLAVGTERGVVLLFRALVAKPKRP